MRHLLTPAAHRPPDPVRMPGLRAPREHERTALREVVNHHANPAHAGNSVPDDPFRTDRFWTRNGRANGPAARPQREKNPRTAGKALCRTRTDDPFLTMEGSGYYERSATVTNGYEIPANSGKLMYGRCARNTAGVDLVDGKWTEARRLCATTGRPTALNVGRKPRPAGVLPTLRGSDSPGQRCPSSSNSARCLRRPALAQ